MAISTRLITYEQSLAMPENKLEEIVDGEIRHIPLPSRQHALLIERMAEILREQLDRKYNSRHHLAIRSGDTTQSLPQLPRARFGFVSRHRSGSRA